VNCEVFGSVALDKILGFFFSGLVSVLGRGNQPGYVTLLRHVPVRKNGNQFLYAIRNQLAPCWHLSRVKVPDWLLG
jgi:hypothetical protein